MPDGLTLNSSSVCRSALWPTPVLTLRLRRLQSGLQLSWQQSGLLTTIHLHCRLAVSSILNIRCWYCRCFQHNSIGRHFSFSSGEKRIKSVFSPLTYVTNQLFNVQHFRPLWHYINVFRLPTLLLTFFCTTVLFAMIWTLSHSNSFF